MNISERIRSLRIEHGLTQNQLCEKMGVSVSTIGYWENGVKMPSVSAVIALCRIFHVSSDYLLGIKNIEDNQFAVKSNQEKRLISNFRSLDRYGKDAVISICRVEINRMEAQSATPVREKPGASPNRYIPHYFNPSAAGFSVALDGDDFEMLLADETVPPEADMAVNISGNSMFPYIHDGDVVFVKKDCELENGDIGIFNVDGTMFCKQYYLDDRRNLHLISANPDLRDSNIDVRADSSSTVVCLGKVLTDRKIPLPKYFVNDLAKA